MRRIRSFVSGAVCLIACVANGADIQLNIIQPTAGALASEALAVRVGVASLYELSSVTAQVEGRQTNLVYSGAVSAWTNSLSLSGLSRGQKTLIVSAQDVFGRTAQTQQVFFVDNPPTLTVNEPANGTVVSRQVRIDAVAGDDDPAGAVITVYAPNNVNGRFDVLLAKGTNSVRSTVNFPATNAAPSTIVFVVTDSSGQQRFIPRKLIIEPSSNLVETAVAPGAIFDFTSDRFLYSSEADIVLTALVLVVPLPELAYGKPEPRIIHRLNGSISTSGQYFPDYLGRLSTFSPNYFVSGSLASTGALLVGASIFPPVTLFSWPEAAPINYGLVSGGTNGVSVAGNTAAWIPMLIPSEPQIVLRDIVQTNAQFSLSLSASGAPFDLAPNLDLVYIATGHVFRSRPASTTEPYVNRTTTQLASREIGPTLGIETDGTNVVFNEQVATPPPNGAVNIQLITPAGEETLATWPNFIGPAFQARNGWVAFTKPGTSGQTQIWTRSPSGVLLQRTFFGSSSTLESLGPNGEVTFLVNNGRYVSLPGAQPWWVNSVQGRVRWQDGKLLIILGRSVFEVRLGSLACATLAGGNTRLTFSGPAGLSYTLLGSSDLENWSEVLTFMNTTGNVSWTNPPSPAFKFYRVTAP
jgi:hypothetical protein